MIQLILHLWGDYFLQPNAWAQKKTQEFKYALLHANAYALVFYLAGKILPDTMFSCSNWALLVIWSTHIVIDRWRPVRHMIFAKNWVMEHDLKWEDCKKTGYPSEMSAWLSTWLMIIADNTLHLTINYVALACL